MKCGIYHIKNLINGMKYIGQSTDLRQRFSQQKSDLKNGRHGNIHLQSAVIKFGIQNFEFRAIAYCLPSELDRLEKFYISTYKSNIRGIGYNIEDGGRVARIIPEETRNRISKASVGRTYNDSTRNIWRKQRAGSGNSRARQVYCTQFGKTWECAKDAAAELGINYYTFMSMISGKDRNHTSIRYVNDDQVVCRKRPVVDAVTGQTWEDYSMAAIDLGLSPGTLRKYLSGTKKNTTNLRYA